MIKVNKTPGYLFVEASNDKGDVIIFKTKDTINFDENNISFVDFESINIWTNGILNGYFPPPHVTGFTTVQDHLDNIFYFKINKQ